uniref:L-amino-acid oxidase (Fragments) n=1 Tax=Bothrops mattogrossensis TaxID=1171125 RepID=OXLA_BOTMT|nr:RecName: Full=L-amino-acid oxidase; Short=Bm-LAO; Short=LAAO [Bothrops matogrossensis]
IKFEPPLPPKKAHKKFWEDDGIYYPPNHNFP